MNERQHDEIRSLIGAYVLHAVSADEERRVEHHLRTCDDCAREVRLLSDSAAELAWLEPAEEANDVVDRIVVQAMSAQKVNRTDIERRSAVGMQSAEAHELIARTDAASGPVALA